MPLLDLKTDLKSLSYGSVAPYIQKDINNPGAPSAGAIQARVEDTVRISKYLLDRGGIFLAKQALLEASKADKVQDIFSAATLLGPASRLANIIAQIPVNGTGTHFLPIGRGQYYTGITDASSRALEGTAIGNVSNAPYPQFASRVQRTRTSFYSADSSKVNVSLRQTIADQNAVNAELAQLGLPPILGSEQSPLATITDTSNQVKTNGVYTINDFKGRESLDTKYGFAAAKRPDAVNLLDVGDGNIKDLVPVVFSVYGDETSTVLGFRGFIQNLSDNFSPTWSPVNYVGRMESFFTYTGFSRTIQFRLTVPTFSEQEQRIIFNKANSLASHTAPEYTGNLPSGIITKLKIGDYINTAGVITGVNIDVSDETPWSEGTESENMPFFNQSDNKVRFLPQVLGMTISFTPIHSTAPRFYSDKLPTPIQA
jgi:hypothetical protein